MYKIVWLYDEHDCEICGWSIEEGYLITKDGEVLVDKQPVAHCFDSVGYQKEQAYLDILNLEGIAATEEVSENA